MENEVKQYPTKPDSEGFYFATQEEEELEIQSKDYENGSGTKNLTLSKGAKVVVRKLRGRDFVQTKNQIQNDKTLDFETVNMAIATTIDGKVHPPEYYLDDLFQEDYSKIIAAYSKLNF